MIDDDLDQPEEFENEKEPVGGPPKPSLKEIWDSNPALKIVALVVVLVAGLGIYMLFSSEEPASSKIHLTAQTKQIPGTTAIDAEYRRRLEEQNQRTAKEQLEHGGSAIPIPTDIPNGGAIKPPTMPDQPRSDVLEEWKKVADQSRMKAAKEAVDEENQAPQLDNIPQVAPIRPQEVKQDPNLSRHLVEQMREILGKQGAVKATKIVITTENSPYIAQKKEKDKEDKLAATAGAASRATGLGASSGMSAGSSKVLVAAGTINYAQLITQLNSDLPGPVLAQMLSGPFAGGRLIGKLTANQDCECMVIEFKEVVKDTINYKIDAIALDENTTLDGIVATDVDHHYFQRYVLPAAASFLTGYSQALSQTGQTQTATAGVGTETATPTANAKQSIFAGLTTGSQSIGNDLNKDANRPPTIVIAQGTTMGVFFTDTVTTGDAGK